MDAEESDLPNLNNEFSRQYPQNTQPLDNQVAGHTFDDDCFTIGMLKHEEGYVLKPVNKPEQGTKEILFYETVTNSTQKELMQLKQFVPEYLGSVELTIGRRRAKFLKLSDATRGYKKPCVMDVKIGRQTWEPGAPLTKQQNEEGKYTACKQQCGFCIPGFQVYDIMNNTIEKYGKEYGRKLTKENIPEVFRKFLNSNCERSRIVAEQMLHQLEKILDWWRTQHLYHIYSSSVLLTYDAEILRTTQEPYSTVTNFSQLPTPNSVRVQLIDFAHVLPANNTLDLNYLSGLEHFVQIFTSVINNL